jgi:hypothetical protein
VIAEGEVLLVKMKNIDDFNELEFSEDPSKSIRREEM